MLFAPWYYGHHPTYLGYLIRYWQQQKLRGKLSIVVMPTFLTAHQDVVDLAKTESQTIKFVPMTAQEQARLESTRPNVLKAFVQYRLIVRYIRKLQATQCLLMHFDSCQIPLVLGLPLPCPVSGVYFTPTLHYTQFPNYSPTRKERRQNLKQRIFISCFLAHPQSKTLFCLDPFAVEFIKHQFHKATQVVHLPDPVEVVSASKNAVSELKKELGIESNRKVLLAFGILADARKGTRQLLEALQQLKPELGQKICILLVGEPFSKGQATIESWLAPVRSLLQVQVITQFGYIPESDVPLYFQLADFVMAPYQRHAGMSGIILLAAGAKKPILSSNYGLMGEVVKHYSLGIAVDTTITAEIAAGLTRLLNESSRDFCSEKKMEAFVACNSPEKFANTIFQHI